MFHKARSRMLTVLMLVPMFSLGLVQADESTGQRIMSRVGSQLQSGFSSCGATINESISAASECFANQFANQYVGQLVNGIVRERLTRFLNDGGQAVFGEYFSVVHRMNFSPTSRGFDGHLDAIIPIGLFSATGEGVHPRAMFLQNGLTRWTDRNGVRRNDVRFGTMYRFALSEDGADIVGVGALMQQSLERGHKRMVTRLDYAGRWGGGSFNRFEPTTGWLPGRSGHEEKALAGIEFGLRFKATTTLGLETTLARWDDEDGSDNRTTNGRVGVTWKPHDWVRLSSQWEGIGAGENTRSFQADVTVPLNGKKQIPQWEGLGEAGLAATANANDLWRPVDDIGKIEYAERVAPVPAIQLSEVGIRFMQESAGTGDEIRVEVTLPSVATGDVRFLVQLMPGAGDNPAVAGEDFPEDPIEVIIRSGELRGEAIIQLPNNPGIQQARTLAATLSLLRA